MSVSVFFVDAEDAETAGFLARLYDDEVATVLSYAQSRRYASGEMAIRHGELDRSLFVITAGRFEVLVPTPIGPQRASLSSPAIFSVTSSSLTASRARPTCGPSRTRRR
jgi:CRP-like cAMP-binding protein